jgi:hypothetical protein
VRLKHSTSTLLPSAASRAARAVSANDLPLPAVPATPRTCAARGSRRSGGRGHSAAPARRCRAPCRRRRADDATAGSTTPMPAPKGDLRRGTANGASDRRPTRRAPCSPDRRGRTPAASPLRIPNTTGAPRPTGRRHRDRGRRPERRRTARRGCCDGAGRRQGAVRWPAPRCRRHPGPRCHRDRCDDGRWAPVDHVDGDRTPDVVHQHEIRNVLAELGSDVDRPVVTQRANASKTTRSASPSGSRSSSRWSMEGRMMATAALRSNRRTRGRWKVG